MRPDNRLDQFSPFRRHLRRARAARKHAVSVTVEDLKQQWDIQGGRCALTGIPLENPPTSSTRNEPRLTPWRASLDRIDHRRGYEVGNVRWICVMANYCRNRFSDEEVMAFATAIARRP